MSNDIGPHHTSHRYCATPQNFPGVEDSGISLFLFAWLGVVMVCSGWVMAYLVIPFRVHYYYYYDLHFLFLNRIKVQNLRIQLECDESFPVSMSSALGNITIKVIEMTRHKAKRLLHSIPWVLRFPLTPFVFFVTFIWCGVWYVCSWWWNVCLKQCACPYLNSFAFGLRFLSIFIYAL